MQFMIWDLEGDPIQAVITALRERLDDWGYYCERPANPSGVPEV